MKTYNKLLIFALTILIFNACDQNYIDPISKVDPGPDQTAPVVTIKYPLEGTQIQRPELISSIVIQFEVTDDIELGSVKVSIDGIEIASYDDFKDYRRIVVDTLSYNNLQNGMHKLSISAADLGGKITNEEVNFEKSPPYIQKYPNEIFYLPFDGDFMDMISFQTATVHGNPGFSDESVVGSKSYAGAVDAYLTFPTGGLQYSEMTAVFWMKIKLSVPAPSYGQRAGILVMGPEDTANPDAQNNRLSGFRFFREDASGKQRFKLNAGNGAADTWFDGANAADVDPATGEWRHFAFTISNTECVVYIDGQIVKQDAFDGIDWTGCDIFSIMSGDPRFTGWNHHSDESLMDELRLFNRALSQEEIQGIITEESGKDFTYTPKYDGEIFYMPFEEDYLEYVSQDDATVVGSPGFAAGKVGNAYAGAPDSYLTFPTDALQGNMFSAVFWMKIQLSDPEPDYGQRAGILVMGPEDTENADYPVKQNNRKNGFRFFREASNAGATQRFKLNTGNGTADTWFDGAANADIEVPSDNWQHFAFTISGTEGVVYINGEIVSQATITGIDWTGCDILTIMSGDPRFTGWDHHSDESLMDELRFFNKALTQEEVQQIIADES